MNPAALVAIISINRYIAPYRLKRESDKDVSKWQQFIEKDFGFAGFLLILDFSWT